MGSEAETPSWLNKEFFQTLLRENEDDPTIVVEHLDVGLAVGKGENFASFMHKAVVSIKKGDHHEQRFLMVKSLPDGEAMLAFIKESQIFEKESRIYLEILPAFQKLQKSSGAAVTPLGCKCFKTSRPYTIVMEDLTRRGYKVAARQLGLDLEHCKLAIKALARFHALSLGLIKDNPKLKDDFADTMLTVEKRALNHHFHDRNVVELVKVIHTWEGYERFGDKLMKSNFLDKNTDLMQIQNKFSALNHGDYWVNNMMFKYSDEGKVEDVQMIDFQVCRFASLAFDLQYFMHSSATEEVRTKHWVQILEEYHQHFLATLVSIDSDTSTMFTLDELKKEVDDKTIFGLFTALLLLPIVLANTEDAPDFTQLEEFDPDRKYEVDPRDQFSPMAKTFSGHLFRKALQSMLPKFESAGVL